jgi:hypothetical protein
MDAIATETSSIPPGPKGYWVVGNLPDFMGDIFGFLTRCARDHGDIVSLRLGPHADLWHDGEARDIRYDMTRLTLEIVAKVLFAVDLAGEVERISQAVDRGFEEISRRFKRGIFLPDWLPTPGNRR